jgi:hypothetical protein
MSNNFKYKYLKYKKKYLLLHFIDLNKKLYGGAMDSESIELLLKNLNLENVIKDIFDGTEHTIQDFLNLDNDSEIGCQDRRVGILVPDIGNTQLFPIYINNYDKELKYNENIFFECKEQDENFYLHAVQITENDIKGSELIKIDGIGYPIYIEYEEFLYMKTNFKYKIWIFNFDSKINRLVNRKFVYKNIVVNDIDDPITFTTDLDGNYVNIYDITDEGQGRTKCNLEINYKYRIDEVNFLETKPLIIHKIKSKSNKCHKNII